MSIFLEWKNNNVSQNVVKIYRSEQPIDRTGLSELTPIATYSENETKHRDDNVEIGKDYYYVFETTVGEKKFTTPNIIRRNKRINGPGDEEISWGDSRLGFMGQVAQPQICTTPLMQQSILLSTQEWTNQSDLYNKFMRKGKILFLPSDNSQVNNTLIPKDIWNEKTTPENANHHITMIRLTHVSSDPVVNLAYRKKIAVKYAIGDDVDLSDIVLASGGFKYLARLPKLCDTVIKFNAENTGVATPSVTLLDGEFLDLITNANSPAFISENEKHDDYIGRQSTNHLMTPIYNGDVFPVSAEHDSDNPDIVCFDVIKGNIVLNNLEATHFIPVFELIEG